MLRNMFLVMTVAVSASFGAANASVITFGPGSIGSPVGSTVEGNYTYDTYGGALFRDTQGNGDLFNMEGLSGTGGVLSIVRTDGAGVLFTFDGADIGWQFNRADTIYFEGFLGGLSQGSDSFLTTADSLYSTIVSSILSGLVIDELRITMNAPSGTASILDNVILSEKSAVPAPAALGFLGFGLAGLGVIRRKRSVK